MSAIEILNDIGIDLLHEKTNIPIKLLTKLLNFEYQQFSRVQFMGFIQIIEREFEVDLFDLKESYDAIYDQSFSSEDYSTPNENALVKIKDNFYAPLEPYIKMQYAFLLIVLASFFYLIFYINNSSVKKMPPPVQQIESKTISAPIQNEINYSEPLPMIPANSKVTIDTSYQSGEINITSNNKQPTINTREHLKRYSSVKNEHPKEHLAVDSLQEKAINKPIESHSSAEYDSKPIRPISFTAVSGAKICSQSHICTKIADGTILTAKSASATRYKISGIAIRGEGWKPYLNDGWIVKSKVIIKTSPAQSNLQTPSTNEDNKTL